MRLRSRGASSQAEFSYPSWFTPSVKDLLNKILVRPPLPPAGEWLSHTSANHHNTSANSLIMDQVPSPEKRLTISQIKESDWFLEGGYTEEDESQVIRQ